MHGKNVVHMTSDTDELHFFYDAQNRPAVVVYNGTAYAYVKSLQGDTVAILDENGNTVVSYGYDAWGVPLWCTGELAETLGKVQPFRYRGYVFDEETGLYYLRSRYYGSEWCRFINSDSILTLNLFCYCNNQPINNADSNGMLTTSAFAFKCIDDSSSVYLSPSQRAPEAVLTEGLHGKNTGNIPVAYLLAYLDQMVASGRWAYRANTMLWEKVDCVAMIRTAFQQYSQKLAAQTPTTVGGLRNHAVEAGYECLPLAGNEGKLVPGMAVYWYDPNHKNKDGEVRPWYHVGIYVGTYYDRLTDQWYTDAVIEAASAGEHQGVIAKSLSDIEAHLPSNTSLYYSYLADVDY